MSFNVLPFGRRPTAGTGQGAEPDAPQSPPVTSAEVVELASRRPPAVDIPDVVWDEVEAAAVRWERLRADNREVRFDAGPHQDGVSATLCDLGGGVIRALPLRQALGGDDDGPQSAA